MGNRFCIDFQRVYADKHGQGSDGEKWEKMFFWNQAMTVSLELSGMFQLLQMDFLDTPMTHEKQNKTKH